jgi:hypothetical protein
MPKADKTSVVKKEETQVVVSGLGIEGVDGFNRADLPVPFLKLVHPLSKNIELASGEKAKDGWWFHTGKRIAMENPEIVIFGAKKSQIPDPRHPEIINDGVRILAVEKSDLDSPFAMSLVKGGYWAYKSILGAMNSWKVKHIWDRSIILGSKTAQNKNKDEFLVPTMALTEELDDKSKAIVAKLVEQFSDKIDIEEEDISTPEGNEEIVPENINLDDLDTPIK